MEKNGMEKLQPIKSHLESISDKESKDDDYGHYNHSHKKRKIFPFLMTVTVKPYGSDSER